MGRDKNIPFLELIHEIFDSVFIKYGFVVQEEVLWIQPEKTVYATKDNIRLAFRLGPTRLFWYFSLGIKLLGQLGVRATSESKYREIGVTVIADCLDPKYKRNLKAAQTEEEVREKMISYRDELLMYCEDILLGDVTNWQKVIDCLNEK